MLSPDAVRLERVIAGGGAIARSAGLTFGARVGSRTLSVLFLVVLTRFVSVEEYGDYAYLVGLAITFVVLSDSGVSLVLGREVARGERSAGEAVRLALPVVVGAYGVASLLVLAVGLATFPERLRGVALLATAGFVLAGGVFAFFSTLLRSTGRSAAEAALLLGTVGSFVVAGGAAAAAGAGVGALIALFLAKEVIGIAVALVLLTPSLAHGSLSDAGKRARRAVLRAGLVLALGNVLMAGYSRVSLLVLANLEAAKETGIFAAASRIADVGIMLGSVVGFSLLPALARLSATAPGRARRLLVWTVACAAALSLLAAAATALLAPELVTLVFGERYASAAPAARILALGLPLFVLGPLLVGGLAALGEGWALVHAHLAGALIAAPSALLLIPAAGVEGAALSMVLAYAGVTAVAALHYARKRPLTRDRAAAQA